MTLRKAYCIGSLLSQLPLLPQKPKQAVGVGLGSSDASQADPTPARRNTRAGQDFSCYALLNEANLVTCYTHITATTRSPLHRHISRRTTKRCIHRGDSADPKPKVAMVTTEKLCPTNSAANRNHPNTKPDETIAAATAAVVVTKSILSISAFIGVFVLSGNASASFDGTDGSVASQDW